MKTQQWYKNLVDRIKDTIEYRFESLLLDITENICRKMKEKNINRSKLSQKMNISKPAVTRMLDGNPNFTLKRLLSVADALDLELHVNFREKNDNILDSYTTVTTYLSADKGFEAKSEEYFYDPLSLAPHTSSAVDVFDLKAEKNEELEKFDKAA